MKAGETVTVLIDYDLFGNPVKGKKGVYVCTSESTGKLLVYFSDYGEWAEFLEDQIKRNRPNFVSKKNASFIEKTRKL